MEGRDKRYGAFLRTELRRVREEGGRALYGLALLTRTKSMDGERLWRSQPGFKAMPPTEPFQAACYREQTRGCVRQSAWERNRAGHTEVAQQQNGLFCHSSRQTDVNGKESYGWDG